MKQLGEAFLRDIPTGLQVSHSRQVPQALADFVLLHMAAFLIAIAAKELPDEVFHLRPQNLRHSWIPIGDFVAGFLPKANHRDVVQLTLKVAFIVDFLHGKIDLMRRQHSEC